MILQTNVRGGADMKEREQLIEVIKSQLQDCDDMELLYLISALLSEND